MYFRSHIYCTKEITGSTNPYLLTGSLFPDFYFAGLPTGFERRSIELMKFLNQKYPALVNFALGMTLHEYPIGVDRFIHTEYQGKQGYAFQFQKELLEDSKKLFGTDVAALMTHFFVENAIEFKILKEHPELEKMTKKAFTEIDKKLLVTALSKFYGVEDKKLHKGFDTCCSLIFDYDYSTFEGQGKAWVKSMHMAFGKTADHKEISKIIQKTVTIIEPTVDKFLKECIEACKKDFEYNFPSFRKNLQ